MSGVQNPYEYQYEHVAGSASAQVLGTTGAVGDYLHRLIITVNTAATSAVSIVDGSVAAHGIITNNTPIGVYNVEFNTVSVSGAWKVNTGAGVEVMAVGIFS
jgi:hypothetical protein